MLTCTRISYFFHLLILLCFTTHALCGKDTINSQLVAKFSYPFTLSGSKIEGKGANLLMDKVHSSHYLLLGETHDDASIAVFTAALIPILKANGYAALFTENGNHSLRQMRATVNMLDSGVRGLNHFYMREYGRSKHIPLPFFTGKEDALFYKAAVQYNLPLIGIDQEYLFSFPMLLDVMLSQNSSKEIRYLHKMATQKVHREYGRYDVDTKYPICANLLRSKEIDSFFGKVCHQNPDLQNMVVSIKRSWEIYSLNGTNRSYSFKERGILMHKQFNLFYDSLKRACNCLPKAAFKLGAMHTMRGKTPLKIYDMGHWIDSMAGKKYQDLNILFMFRYYQDSTEKLGYFDNSIGNSLWLKKRRAFMEQGELSSWVIIDLKQLSAFLKGKMIYVHKPLLDIIQRHDFVIIPPATKDVELNYTK